MTKPNNRSSRADCLLLTNEEQLLYNTVAAQLRRALPFQFWNSPAKPPTGGALGWSHQLGSSHFLGHFKRTSVVDPGRLKGDQVGAEKRVSEGPYVAWWDSLGLQPPHFPYLERRGASKKWDGSDLRNRDKIISVCLMLFVCFQVPRIKPQVLCSRCMKANYDYFEERERHIQ